MVALAAATLIATSGVGNAEVSGDVGEAALALAAKVGAGKGVGLLKRGRFTRMLQGELTTEERLTLLFWFAQVGLPVPEQQLSVALNDDEFWKHAPPEWWWAAGKLTSRLPDSVRFEEKGPQDVAIGFFLVAADRAPERRIYALEAMAQLAKMAVSADGHERDNLREVFLRQGRPLVEAEKNRPIIPPPHLAPLRFDEPPPVELFAALGSRKPSVLMPDVRAVHDCFSEIWGETGDLNVLAEAMTCEVRIVLMMRSVPVWAEWLLDEEERYLGELRDAAAEGPRADLDFALDSLSSAVKKAKVELEKIKGENRQADALSLGIALNDSEDWWEKCRAVAVAFQMAWGFTANRMESG